MKTLIATMFLSVAATAAPAQSIAVSSAGLDLSTQAGVRALDLRILHAASEVCGIRTPADSRRDTCRADAIAAAAQARARLIAAGQTETRIATR